MRIESGVELGQFTPQQIMIGRTGYLVLTGFEPLRGHCFWCGQPLKGKLKRYCRGHMKLYWQHFEWSYASGWARKRAGYKCENCGAVQNRQTRSGNRSIEVHHIVPLNGSRRYFSALNLPWNLIVLCHDCHQEVHAAFRPPKPVKAVVERPSERERLIAAGQGVLL
uniref:Putative homing endonuclease n=1 Tax=viral metagenome TaxID=1070528 RepID=A0A6M3Y244_9ZZZZ